MFGQNNSFMNILPKETTPDWCGPIPEFTWVYPQRPLCEIIIIHHSSSHRTVRHSSSHRTMRHSSSHRTMRHSSSHWTMRYSSSHRTMRHSSSHRTMRCPIKQKYLFLYWFYVAEISVLFVQKYLYQNRFKYVQLIMGEFLKDCIYLVLEIGEVGSRKENNFPAHFIIFIVFRINFA